MATDILERDTDLKIKWNPECFLPNTTIHRTLSDEGKLTLKLFPEAREIARFANLVYQADWNKIEKILNETVIKNGKKVFQGWKLFCIGTNSGENYCGASFIRDGNEVNQRQIIISHRGTEDGNLKNPLNWNRLRKNWKSNCEGVVNNVPTSILKSACTFAQDVVKKYDDLHKGDPVQVILTGHSLGGWLAQISCLSLQYMQSDPVKRERFKWFISSKASPHCITFDSPGAEQMLEFYKENVEHIGLDITNYVILPNLINVLNGHFGDLVKIPTNCDEDLFPLPRSVSLKDLKANAKFTMQTHSMKLFLKLLNSDYEIDIESVEVEDEFYTWIAESADQSTTENVPSREIIQSTNSFYMSRVRQWPQVRYSAPSKHLRGVDIGKSIFRIIFTTDAFKPYEAYLYNSKHIIETEDYLRHEIPLVRISQLEKSFIDVLDFLQKLEENVSTVDTLNLLKEMMKILFPLDVPLFNLRKSGTDLMVWPLKLKDNKIVFDNEASYFRFKNMFQWNSFISEVKIPGIHLWQWVKESVKHYEDLKDFYILPEFHETSPKLANYARDIRMPKAELLLLVLDILRKNDGTIVLKFMEKDEKHFIKSIDSLKGCMANAQTVVLDFSASDKSIDNIGMINVENLKIYFLIPTQTSNVGERFSIEGRCVDEIMEKEIFSDGFNGSKRLFELVKWKHLQRFLEKNPGTTLDLLKRNDKFFMGPFTRTVLDSRFTYFQVGVTYSFAELTEYYQKKGESPHKTVVVFVTNDDSNTLEQKQNDILNVKNIEVHPVDRKLEHFIGFTRICKLNEKRFVDLIRCNFSNEVVSDWRFEHLYQYNPEFYFKRHIVPPAIHLAGIFKALRDKCKNYEDREIIYVVRSRHVRHKDITASLPLAVLTPQEKEVVNYLEKEGQNNKYHPHFNFNFRHVSQDYLILEPLIEKGRNIDYCRLKIPAQSPLTDEEILFGESKFCILSDEPGMGKSTTVLRMLPRLIKNTNHIVALFELKNLQHLEALETSDNTVKSFVDFISKNKGQNNTLSSLLLHEMLREGRGYKLIVVFDGYDEMVKEQRKLFKEILPRLWDLRNINVIISTRSSDQDSLETSLYTFSHMFVPIEKLEDKAHFLTNIWAGILRCKKEDLLPLAREIISKAHEHLLQGRESFLGVPLQLRILSEISLKLAEKWLLKKDESVEIQEFIEEHKNLAKIYEHFVNRKLELYAQEKLGYVSKNKEEFVGIIKSSIKNTLYWLAGIFLGLGENFEHFTYDCYTLYSDTFETLLKTGIVYGSYDKETRPQFLHKTFAEFFAAKCVFEVIKKVCFEESDKYNMSRKHLITFVYNKFVEGDRTNEVIKDFLISMINDDTEMLKSLKMFELKILEIVANPILVNQAIITTYSKAAELVWKRPDLFLLVKDPLIADFVMNGFTNYDIKDFIRKVKFHLAFFVGEKIGKVKTALSALFRRFCKQYNGDVTRAPFLYQKKEGDEYILFSLQDVLEVFSVDGEEISENNPFKETPVVDFVKSWPVLSCLVLDDKFQVIERLQSLCEIDRTSGNEIYPVYYVKEDPKEGESSAKKSSNILDSTLVFKLISSKIEGVSVIPESNWVEESAKQSKNGIYKYIQ